MGNFPLCKTSEICIYYSQVKKLNIENNENNEFYDTENEEDNVLDAILANGEM